MTADPVALANTVRAGLAEARHRGGAVADGEEFMPGCVVCDARVALDALVSLCERLQQDVETAVQTWKHESDKRVEAEMALDAERVARETAERERDEIGRVFQGGDPQLHAMYERAKSAERERDELRDRLDELRDNLEAEEVSPSWEQVDGANQRFVDTLARAESAEARLRDEQERAERLEREYAEYAAEIERRVEERTRERDNATAMCDEIEARKGELARAASAYLNRSATDLAPERWLREVLERYEDAP